MSEIDFSTAIEWIVSTLKANTDLAALVGARVYVDQIPPQIPEVFPYVIVSEVPQSPLENISADIVWFDDLVDVDVYDHSASGKQAAQAFGCVLQALHKKSGSTAHGTVHGCTFEGRTPFPPEVEGMEIYQRKSGQFRVIWK